MLTEGVLYKWIYLLTYSDTHHPISKCTLLQNYTEQTNIFLNSQA